MNLFISFLKQNVKKIKLFELCALKSLDPTAIERLHQLVKDDSVDVNSADRYGRTPLLLLCNNQSNSLYQAIETLLDSGKNVNISATEQYNNDPV